MARSHAFINAAKWQDALSPAERWPAPSRLYALPRCG
jgi:hypothetical protein